MIKYALWESSSWSGSSKSLSETEWLSYWKVAFHIDKRSTSNWVFFVNNTSSLGHCLIDWSNNIIWSLDFYQEDWFLKSWLSCKLTSVKDSSSSWDDLTTSSMDSISMESNIMDVKSATSHIFVTHGTFFGSPLESSFYWILDFVKELYTLCNINKDVCASCVWTKAPDFLSICFIPIVFFAKYFGSFFWISLWSKLSFLNLKA